MSEPHVAAVGGSPAFPPLVARVLGTTPEDVTWLPSVTSAERALAEAMQPFDVVVLAPGVKDEEAINVAELASKEAPTTAIIVVRETSVDGAFPRLVRAGVRDVVDLSRGSGEFKEALKRAVEWSAGVRGTASAQVDDGAGFCVADLDLERLAEVRAQIPSLANRRPEAYEL